MKNNNTYIKGIVAQYNELKIESVAPYVRIR